MRLQFVGHGFLISRSDAMRPRGGNAVRKLPLHAPLGLKDDENYEANLDFIVVVPDLMHGH